MPKSNKLTDHQRAVVELMKTPGFTWSTVAKRLGCGVSALKSAHALAMKKLDREAAGETFPARPTAKSLAKPTTALKRYMTRLAEVGPMPDKDAVVELGKTRDTILWHINNTPEIISHAPLRELVSAANMTIEKMQLLQGEPTAITRFQDIRKLDEVAEMLNSELKRRGKLIDVVAEEV